LTPTSQRPPDPKLHALLTQLGEEGWEMWAHFDREVRHHRWHSFVPAEYDRVLAVLTELWRPGLRFLELGSATGIITVMADLLGYEACGIEIDERLVQIARETTVRYGSKARFAAGSFLPQGWAWRPRNGDGRLGTIGEGASGYLELGMPLDEFDLVYAYPWGGEEAMMLDLYRAHGAPEGHLLLHLVSGELRLMRRGRIERSWPHAGSSGHPTP
jgi:SAM-dependent methyltransferase